MTDFDMHYINYYESPLGGILLTSDVTSLTGLWFTDSLDLSDLPLARQGHFAPCPDDGYSGKGCFGDSVSGDKYSGNGYVDESLPVFESARRWLDCYFSGMEPDFMPPLHLSGTAFQTEVWEILLTIPYGQTVTYGEIAMQIAQKHDMKRMAAQAVGGAVGSNKISIIVPCHRVIGANGHLTGYGGGLDKKTRLLELEGIDVSKFTV